jgi:MFS family permease
MLTFLSTLVFVSSISGMLLFTTFTEGFGRKNSLLLSSSLILAGVILTLLSGYFSSIYLTFIGIVLTYWGTENSFQFIYCFASEVVAEEWRITYINLINVVYGLGMALDAILFEYIQEWTTIYICAFLIPAALVVFSVFFFIEKTPIDLLASE